MPSQVGITLGIVQALYHKPVALAKLDTTAFSDAVTLGSDLLVELSIGGEGDIFSCAVVSTTTSLALLTISLCRAIESANSFAMPSSPRRCLKWTRSLAAQGWPHWKVTSPAKYWLVGVLLPHGYHTFITEVIEVFEHQQGSHFSDGVARRAYLAIERSEGFFYLFPGDDPG
jgi:hypothetical protein